MRENTLIRDKLQIRSYIIYAIQNIIRIYAKYYIRDTNNICYIRDKYYICAIKLKLRGEVYYARNTFIHDTRYNTLYT